jgi:phage-related protein
VATFTWTHDYGAELSEEPRVLSAQFGDGYAQEIYAGINAIVRRWSLSFANRERAEIAEMLAFLRENSLAFDWTDPNGQAGRWKCASWRQSHVHAAVQTLSAEFEEVFGR